MLFVVCYEKCIPDQIRQESAFCFNPFERQQKFALVLLDLSPHYQVFAGFRVEHSRPYAYDSAPFPFPPKSPCTNSK